MQKGSLPGSGEADLEDSLGPANQECRILALPGQSSALDALRIALMASKSDVSLVTGRVHRADTGFDFEVLLNASVEVNLGEDRDQLSARSDLLQERPASSIGRPSSATTKPLAAAFLFPLLVLVAS